MSSIDGLSLEEAAKLSIALEGAVYYFETDVNTYFINADCYEVALYVVYRSNHPSWYTSKSIRASWTDHLHTDQELKPITNLLKE
jgi:hypothetical protein